MRLPNRDRKILDELQRSLQVIDDRAPQVASFAIEPMAALYAGQFTILYSLAAKPDAGFRVSFLEQRGRDQITFKRAFSDYFENAPDNFGSYNPIVPEAAARNRIVDWHSLDVIYRENDLPPMVREFFPRFSLRWQEQLRVILCDGPSLLGWAGIFVADRPTARDVQVLQDLVEPLRRRLMAERALGWSEFVSSALAESLEEISGEAYVMHPRGAVLYANSAGRQALDASARGTIRQLQAELGARGRIEGSSVRELRLGGEPYFLLVRRPNRSRAALDQLARTCRLTSRETQVLKWLAEGTSNARIAAELGISERTAAAHVAAILAKADVANRAALVAKLARYG